MQKVIKGQLVNYETFGRGPQLLILHGWRGNIQHWIPVAKKLEDRYQVTVLDLPGFGNSPKPNLDWSIFDYAEFVSVFIQELKLGGVTVMGHSFGGRIAILLGSRYRNLLKRLILVDAAGMEIKDLKYKIAHVLKPIKILVPDFIKNILRSKDYIESGEMRNIFKKVVGQDLRAELQKINLPTLIIWGEKDKVLSLKEAQMLHSGIKNSILRIVWGGDHWPHMNKLDKFLNILEEENI